MPISKSIVDACESIHRNQLAIESHTRILTYDHHFVELYQGYLRSHIKSGIQHHERILREWMASLPVKSFLSALEAAAIAVGDDLENNRVVNITFSDGSLITFLLSRQFKTLTITGSSHGVADHFLSHEDADIMFNFEYMVQIPSMIDFMHQLGSHSVLTH